MTSSGVFQGESTILVGCGHSDSDGGIEIDVKAGDVIVLPAGTGHCNLQSTGDYKYIGVYPKVIRKAEEYTGADSGVQDSPWWRSELGKQAIDHEALRQEVESVSLPVEDPVNGKAGPLLELWR
jgi:uncharacterized protein YjlB